MNWWQILLFPFAIIYDLVTRSRNWLFDNGFKKINSYPELTIISVGNLSVGGTGKTPMVEFLIRHGLSKNWQMAVLSRGYGRKTKGLLIADKNDSPATIGDEPFGYYSAFGEKISVVVAERRAEGIEGIKNQLPKIKVILLDDAFQHRSVRPDLSFLLTTSKNPYWQDFVLPSGMLRETRRGANRADLVIISKSEEIFVPPINMPFAQSTVKYKDLNLVSGEEKKKVIAIAGLANSEDFFNHVSAQYDIKDRIQFADHHAYTSQDVSKIIRRCHDLDAMMLTTHKDAVKLKYFEELNEVTWGYLPIEVKFISGEQKVLNLLHTMDSRTRNEPNQIEKK